MENGGSRSSATRSAAAVSVGDIYEMVGWQVAFAVATLPRGLHFARSVPIALHRTTSHDFQALAGGVTSSDLGNVKSQDSDKCNFAVEALLGAHSLASCRYYEVAGIPAGQ